jgi:hypothetical protein
MNRLFHQPFSQEPIIRRESVNFLAQPVRRYYGVRAIQQRFSKYER